MKALLPCLCLLPRSIPAHFNHLVHLNLCHTVRKLRPVTQKRKSWRTTMVWESWLLWNSHWWFFIMSSGEVRGQKLQQTTPTPIIDADMSCLAAVHPKGINSIFIIVIIMLQFNNLYNQSVYKISVMKYMDDTRHWAHLWGWWVFLQSLM